MKYFISYSHPEKHFIDFKLIINTKDLNILKLQLPAWRPGRYELGNFAKNIKDFNAFGAKNEFLNFSKKTKDLWLIECEKFDKIVVK